MIQNLSLFKFLSSPDDPSFPEIYGESVIPR